MVIATVTKGTGLYTQDLYLLGDNTAALVVQDIAVYFLHRSSLLVRINDRGICLLQSKCMTQWHH